MLENIYSTDSFELVAESDQLYMRFFDLHDRPKIIFESLEKYLFETQGADFLHQLAEEVLKSPARYDQRLTYDFDQSIDPPREAFYLDGSYFCQNNDRKFQNTLDSIKYAIGMYSDGKSLHGIAEYLHYVLNQATLQSIDINNREHYCLISSLICIIRLLELDDDYPILNELKEVATQDRLLDVFFNKKNQPDINVPLIHQDPYLFMSMELTRDESHLEDYCKNYFHSMKSTSWYDSHRYNFSEFFGYWSFELAYIVRFLDVEDVPFMDHMYYPRDMALHKFLPTWRGDKIGEKAREYTQQFSSNGPKVSNILTKEILSFVESEMASAVNAMLSSDLFNKTMSKISSSIKFFESIQNEPTEEEFAKIRGIVKDLTEIISDYSGKLVKNKHLQNLENKIKAKVVQHFNQKGYSKKEIEQELDTYLKSESFRTLAEVNYQKFVELSDELLIVQEIQDEEKYWDELEKVFNNYGMLNQGTYLDLKSKIGEQEEKKKPSNKNDISFRISFNDYL